MIDITGYELIKIEKGENGQYNFPKTPSGVLPFFINEDNKIVWGCVETDRVGVKVITPPAGTQDIIAIKSDIRLVIEVSKPLKNYELDFLKPLVEKNISDQNYQDLISLLIAHGFDVYFEAPLATAIHETQEEHGIDLREKEGLHKNLLISMFEFEPQIILAKRGTTTQKIFAAYLSSSGKAVLNHIDKIEEKILLNKGRVFCERGIWTTLEDLKLNFLQERKQFDDARAQDKIELNAAQIALIEAEFKACNSRIELIEKIETSLVLHLNVSINSEAQGHVLKVATLKAEDYDKKEYNQALNMHRVFSQKSADNLQTEIDQDFKKKEPGFGIM